MGHRACPDGCGEEKIVSPTGIRTSQARSESLNRLHDSCPSMKVKAARILDLDIVIVGESAFDEGSPQYILGGFQRKENKLVFVTNRTPVVQQVVMLLTDLQ